VNFTLADKKPSERVSIPPGFPETDRPTAVKPTPRFFVLFNALGWQRRLIQTPRKKP